MSESSESPDPTPTSPLDSAGTAPATWLRRRGLMVASAIVVAALFIAAGAWALWPSQGENEASPDRTTSSSGPARTPSASANPSASESASPAPSVSVGPTGGGAPGAWTPPAPGGEYVAEFALPAAPTLLNVEALNGTTVRVRWADNSNNETKFSVHSWPSIKIFDVPANTQQYDFGNLMPEAEHCFAVAAFNGPRRSPEAMPYPGPAWTCVRTPPTAPPAAPSGLTGSSSANNGTTTMHLRWTDNSLNETRFVLDTGNLSYGIQYVSASTTEYRVNTNTTIEEFVEYCFRVKADNSVGSSAWSNQYCMTPLPAPAAPSNLTATATSSSTILLTWNDNSSVEETFILWRQNHLPPAYPPANATSYEWGGLTANTQYCFRIQARNASWTSGAAPGGWTFLCATTLA